MRETLAKLSCDDDVAKAMEYMLKHPWQEVVARRQLRRGYFMVLISSCH
jgi:hypothetical protein